MDSTASTSVPEELSIVYDEDALLIVNKVNLNRF